MVLGSVDIDPSSILRSPAKSNFDRQGSIRRFMETTHNAGLLTCMQLFLQRRSFETET